MPLWVAFALSRVPLAAMSGIRVKVRLPTVAVAPGAATRRAAKLNGCATAKKGCGVCSEQPTRTYTSPSKGS